ncbi:hypothetical protein [Rhizobium leguminosarum]|uniref:hypothetical protein n=1 Tax=Rhizobium leguminosarum TaxID=384 RepID=UPI001F1AAE55|nr:hypothetical protein [Rhizobium leguminosarum]UIJ82205.1 hypothetical protein LZK78_25170 [Rhizobium leguminosarum]
MMRELMKKLRQGLVDRFVPRAEPAQIFYRIEAREKCRIGDGVGKTLAIVSHRTIPS